MSPFHSPGAWRSAALACPFLAAALAMPAGAEASGTASNDPAISNFRSYLVGQLRSAQSEADVLAGKLAAGDIEGSRAAWTKARKGWERSETITGKFFPDLDKAIDAWPDGATGFHAIEARLFADGKAEEITPIARKLAADLATLVIRLKKVKLDREELYAGMANLAFEIGESKSKGLESQLSNTSLNDIQSNLEGLVEVYGQVFAPAFRKAKPETDAAIRKQIDLLRSEISVTEMSKLDQKKVEKAGEGLALLFVDAAPVIGMPAPDVKSDD